MEHDEEALAAEVFRHAPLDHAKPSLRLVQLLPELSPAGLIQCTIFRTTIEASYTGLSYRWGAHSPGNFILINNKRFWVRQNLLDFLMMARGNNETSEVFYWIDALCIDQANKRERVHQLAQMGQIFSRADRVFLWLGSADPTLAGVLPILRDPENATPQQWSIIRANQRALEDYICGNEYWERAWIIQEIFLAKSVTVWADTEPFLFEHLHWTIDYFYLSWKDTPIAQFKLSTKSTPDPRALISAFEEARSLYQGASIISLLAHFRNKKCTIPRDRIFSLTSMSAEGPKVRIDYNASDSDIVRDVLQHCTTSMCVCTPLIVAQCIGFSGSLATLFPRDTTIGPYLEIKVRNIVSFHPGVETIYLDGITYIVRSLRINYIFYEGSSTMCESLQEMLYYLSSKRQIVRVSDEVARGIRFDARRPFTGKFLVPSSHTPSSYLQQEGALWITRALRPYGPLAWPTFYHAWGFNVEEKDADLSIVRISLGAVPHMCQLVPEKCPKAKLIGKVKDWVTERITVCLKNGDWNVKPTIMGLG